MMATPQTSTKCCIAAPFVLEFDTAGKLLSKLNRAYGELTGTTFHFLIE